MKIEFKDRILIDSVYCHQGGGKTILDFFIQEITRNEKQENFYFLIDDRYINQDLKNVSSIKANERNRFSFYKKNKKQIRALICFGNVPPPVNLKCKSLIYFHNDLLIDWRKSNYSFFNKSTFLLKNIYLRLKNKKNYIWLVQTNLMKSKLEKSFKLKNDVVKIFPIFYDKKEVFTKNLNKKFLYVTDNKPHKNLVNLIKAFNFISDHELEIHITITEKEFEKLKIKKPLNKNLKLYLHGKKTKLELQNLYKDCHFFIFPSLKESFGLPLIEASLYGCKVIASNLDFVHEVISPTLLFNPNSVSDIANKIQLSLSNKYLKESTVKVSNKDLYLINYLLN